MQKRKPWLQPGNPLSFFHFLPFCFIFIHFYFCLWDHGKKKKKSIDLTGNVYNRGTNFFPPVLCESLPLFSGLISRATRLFSTACQIFVVIEKMEKRGCSSMDICIRLRCVCKCTCILRKNICRVKLTVKYCSELSRWINRKLIVGLN